MSEVVIPVRWQMNCSAISRLWGGSERPRFQVAGYARVDNRLEQQVYLVDTSADSPQRLNEPGVFSAKWNGETDVFSRLTSPVACLDANGNQTGRLPDVTLPVGHFTLQDAIDFATYSVRATIDSIRFQVRSKTVGGPIDVLVIKPGASQWIQQKKLHP